MLTQNEINALSLSPTKKDFVQVWNELLDVSGKLSERWDPTSTNESDPGIVILKALAGIADKLNYTIDKNILEAFMPTAAQEDSMRKLCDMLGYNIKYYRSAQTDVTIKYYNADPSTEEASAIGKGLLIPKFTVITNSDKDINYFTTNQTSLYISSTSSSVTVPCMEGQIVKCEGLNDNNVITANQISERNRFYLPETNLAENGIFVYNVFNSEVLGGSGLEDGTPWELVDNLNTQPRGSRVFKFGFDSYESRPYLEFPDDYSSLFNDGIFIYYARTNGVNGNVSAKTLTQLELPTGEGWGDVSVGSFSVENTFAATTGADLETIKQAYNNFKKTIGTFETLVTCRDYMNKIYTMTNSNNRPLVSNVLVTDIRNDLNKAVTICSCDDAGIFYKEVSLDSDVPLSDVTKPVFNSADNKWHLGSKAGIVLTDFIDDSVQTETKFAYGNDGTVYTADRCWVIKQGDTAFKTTLSIGATAPAIDHFDLVVYPFKAYTQIKSVKSNIASVRNAYDASYEYSSETFSEIDDRLKDSVKTIAHNLVTPNKGDIVSINNYYRLSATIATNSKITSDEGILLKENIKIALANAFNMRELDFGEEIPFESIVNTIERADSRIKLVALNEPLLYTTFSVYDGDDDSGNPIIKEYAVASDYLTAEEAKAADRFNIDKLDSNRKLMQSTFDTDTAKKIYNELAVRNLLAGRLPLFKYNTKFKNSFSEGAYRITEELGSTRPHNDLAVPTEERPFTILRDGDVVYTGRYNGADPVLYTKTYVPEEYVNNIVTQDADGYEITNITTHCEIAADSDGNIEDVKLEKGEFVKFRAPNFITSVTYPAYVNYHLVLNKELITEARNASAVKLFDLLNKDRSEWSEGKSIGWQKVLDYFDSIDRQYGTKYKQTAPLTQTISKYTPAAGTGEDLCTAEGNEYGQHIIDVTTSKCKYCGKKMYNPIQNGPIVVDINNNQESTGIEELYKAIELSGCIKLTSQKARLLWSDAYGDTVPSGSTGPNLEIALNIQNPFITNTADIDKITEAINTRLNELVSQVKNDGITPVLPTECAWKLCFDFEWVPFEAGSLVEWEKFTKSVVASNIFGFTPVTEAGGCLWRVYGDSYADGKYILQSKEKLIKFESRHMDLLSIPRLGSIYVASDLGKDAEPAVVTNNTERMLGKNEFLYIEYTPSVSSEDGTTQELSAKSEVYREGTIIRPSGFEVGLLDSDVYKAQGNTPFKTVSFETKTGSTEQVEMFRFGANEQVEIRELSKVTLPEDMPKSATSIYYYKNFNGCDALEAVDYTGERSYTLKDGEYIFYTDQNKSEYVFYTTGTKVSLGGNLTLHKFNTIDLATILDAGPQEIPWKYLHFTGDDSITFQEYQYITLGPEDTINKLKLLDNPEKLTEQWQYCDAVEYTVGGSTEPEGLPSIEVLAGTGNGWEVCSTLELDAAYNKAQTLRTGQVSTSIKLSGMATDGSESTDEDSGAITIEPKLSSHPISFKTDLQCQSSSNKINIDDIYSNPDKLSSFTVKIFTEEAPAIVETAPGQTVPRKGLSITDITKWAGEPVKAKGKTELWTTLDLEKLRESQESSEGHTFDSALRLPVSIIPNTYGVFSIYLNCQNATESATKVWIELLPGTSDNAVTFMHLDSATAAERLEKPADAALPSKLYLNSGINCIRINQTGELFIKASSEAQGALYFDDLSLVNCSRVTSATDKTKELPILTNGLNLEQLGYLATTDTGNSVSEETRNTVKTGYANEAKSAIKTLANEHKKAFSDDYAALLAIKDDLQFIVSTEQQVYASINNLYTMYPEAIEGTDNEALKGIIERYIKVENALRLEEALSNALTENRPTEEIEQKLASLFNSLSILDSLKQKLLNDLEAARTTIVADEVVFTKEDVIQDFTEYAKKNSISKEVEDAIKVAARSAVEAEYAEKLSALTFEVEEASNSEDRNRLLTVLSNLRTEINSDVRNKLANLVSKLLTASDGAEVDSLVKSIRTAANTAAYSVMYDDLLQLRTIINNQEIHSLISDLSVTTNEADIELLIAALKELLAGTNSYIDTIDTLLGEVKKHLNNTTPAVIDSIVKDAEDLYNEMTSTSYKNSISSILTEISALLNTLDASFDTTISTLLKSRNGRIKELATQLSRVEALRIGKLSKITNNTSIVAYDTLPFGEVAVYEVWSNEMRKELVTGIDILYATVYNATTLGASEYKFSNVFANRTILTKIAKPDSFGTLYARAEELDLHRARLEASKKLINEISGLIEVPAAVTNAITSIKELYSGSNNDNANIIIAKIDKFDTADTVIDKYSAMQAIKEVLAISIDEKRDLHKILTDLLCPSLSLLDTFGTDVPKVYAPLVELLNSVKDALLYKQNGPKKFDSIAAGIKYLSSLLEPMIEHDNEVVLYATAKSEEEFVSWLKGWANSIGQTPTISAFSTDLVLKVLLSMANRLAEHELELSVINADLLVADLDAFYNDDNAVQTLKDAIELLKKRFDEIDDLITSTAELSILELEQQLLSDIRAIDTERSFYYTVPVETSMAIEFNEIDTSLMSPRVNFDINNINNSFVISKLDIDYLTNGLRIAQSSRLN